MGLFLFLAPDRALEVWPWMLTPLTARGTGGIFCLGIAGLGILFDRSWQAVRIPLQVAIVMLALILVSVVRGQDDVLTTRGPVVGPRSPASSPSSSGRPSSTGRCPPRPHVDVAAGQSVRLNRRTAMAKTTSAEGGQDDQLQADRHRPAHPREPGVERLDRRRGDRSRWPNTTWRMGWTA